MILKDVKYMPDVSRNLIFYGMFEKSVASTEEKASRFSFTKLKGR